MTEIFEISVTLLNYGKESPKRVISSPPPTVSVAHCEGSGQVTNPPALLSQSPVGFINVILLLVYGLSKRIRRLYTAHK